MPGGIPLQRAVICFPREGCNVALSEYFFFSICRNPHLCGLHNLNFLLSDDCITSQLWYNLEQFVGHLLNFTWNLILFKTVLFYKIVNLRKLNHLREM